MSRAEKSTNEFCCSYYVPILKHNATMKVILLVLFGLCCTVQGSWMWQQNCNRNESQSAFVYNGVCTRQALPENSWRSMNCEGNQVAYKTCSDAKCSKQCQTNNIPTQKCDAVTNKVTFCGDEPNYGALVNSTSYAIVRDSDDNCKSFYRTQIIPLNKCTPADGLEGEWDKYECKGTAMIMKSYSDPDCTDLVQTDKFPLKKCAENGSQYECVQDGKEFR